MHILLRQKYTWNVSRQADSEIFTISREIATFWRASRVKKKINMKCQIGRGWIFVRSTYYIPLRCHQHQQDFTERLKGKKWTSIELSTKSNENLFLYTENTHNWCFTCLVLLRQEKLDSKSLLIFLISLEWSSE